MRGSRRRLGPLSKVVATALALAAVGCVADDTRPCGDVVCPSAKVCAPGGNECVEAGQVVSCDGQVEGAACELDGIGAGRCRAGVCRITACGDQRVDPGELCDDGNDVDDDACTNQCTLPVCGDGVRQGDESCDDGAGNGDDRACTAGCASATCGDGLLHAGVEACDLGAGNADGGACTLACARNVCGDGRTWLGVEACDDGNDDDEDACRNACTLPSCGDGVVQAGETCDLGAGNGDDRACTLACQDNVCGDGKLLLGVEGCDAGVGNADDATCTLACTSATCGDGHVWVGVEPCDDGNQASGDGCRGDCRKLEACGDGELDADEACDDGVDGQANPADGCDACGRTIWRADVTLGDEEFALDLGLASPASVALDRQGNVFIAEADQHRIRRVAADTGTITIVAGTGSEGFSGDGGVATSAQLAFPLGLALDGSGNLYIADARNHRVRRVAASTGVITTVAGNGLSGFSGDGGAATAAQLAYPIGLALDGVGSLFVADHDNHRVRRIAAATGVISTVAGLGSPGFAGDGGGAAAAQLASPRGLAMDGAGNLFIADTGNHRIRRVAAATGFIATVAGTGELGFAGDGGAATSAQLFAPYGVAVAPAGDLLIADTGSHRVRRVDAPGGVITTVAGTGDFGFSGDGGAATGAQLAYPWAVAVDAAGDLVLADHDNRRIRRVRADTGIITTIAGSGDEGSSGDGSAATSAPLAYPRGVAVDRDGDLFVADASNHRILRIGADASVRSTVAGSGRLGSLGDGGLATEAQLAYPQGVAVDADGNLFVADYNNHRVRRVDASTGLVTTVAGTGVPGFSGDGAAGASAQIAFPYDVAVDRGGNLFVSDWGNHRVRRVAAATGIITTFAGSGTMGFGGDGGAATAAALASPQGVALDPAGNLYIADPGNHRIRRVNASDGVISTFAGTGTAGDDGDASLATAARLAGPSGVAVDPAGNLIVADQQNHRIRRIDASTGIITTIAGTGLAGFVGDGDDALRANLSFPQSVAVNGAGDVFFADGNNHRIRRVDTASGVISTVAGLLDPERMGPAAQARLADPRGLALTAPFTLVAGGATGTLQALRPAPPWLEVVAGRYPQFPATGDLARFRSEAFGAVGGVAYDAALGRIYLTETTAHRLHVVTVVDVDDASTWTIATLAGDAAGAGTAGFADGPALAARFDSPSGLFFDEAARVLYVADAGNHVVRALPIDAAGLPGEASTFAGTPRTLGIFGDGGAATDALLYGPQAITRCGNGDVFIADTTNQRVRRVAAGSGVITTVLGDGVAASSGQGSPAATFPVDTPLGLACDPFGNLFVTSRTVVRLLVADPSGTVDGTGAVQTVYGAAPRTDYPASVTSCLTGIAVVDAQTVQFTDSCAGVLGELSRQPVQ